MRVILVVLVCLLCVVCSVEAKPAVEVKERGGHAWYEFALDVDGVIAIPFYARLPEAGGDGVAYIQNAREEVPVEFARNGDSITLTFPHYDSTIALEESAFGQLEGTWTRMRSSGVSTMAVRGQRLDEAPDLYSEDAQGEPERARYAMSFEKSGEAVGLIDIHHAPGVEGVTGTILTPTGDYRFLSGAVFQFGRKLGLTVFDGAHAFLFTADVDPNTGDLTSGHFHSGNHWHETFTARRLAEDEEFELPDPFSEVSLMPGETRLGLPKLSEPPYAGNPTIVQIMGTWCPNCHDEAPALVDLYEEHHEEGLQILSLCYEYTDDAERSRRQIERFKERHGATWEFAAAGTSDKSKAAATLPALSAIKSYPTTIWVNPDGTVRAIHSGFSGPATGEKHEVTLAEFERLTREIVEAQ